LPHFIGAMVPGPYKIEALRFEFTSVVTNKASYVAYRGPWAAETFVRERAIDLVARQLAMEPIEVRLRNVVTDADQPASMVTGRSLAGINISQALEKIYETVDLPAFRRRQSEAQVQGRYLGIGIAAYIEPAPGPRMGDTPLGAERMRMHV